jgi:hypothetical protein
MNEKLAELLVPFPEKYIKNKPGGRGGDYVMHGVVRQRLLDVVGFYDWSIDREIYDDSGKLTGCVGTLTINLENKTIKVQGSGDVENDQGSNGSNLKHAESDAFKRAAMNLGLGLHLWCGDEYFIYNKNKNEQGSESL